MFACLGMAVLTIKTASAITTTSFLRGILTTALMRSARLCLMIFLA